MSYIYYYTKNSISYILKMRLNSFNILRVLFDRYENKK